MTASHADADAEKGHLLQEEDDEGSSSELSGGRTAVASPTNRLASLDIEGLNDLDVEKEAASTQERPQKNGAKLIAWITINTLATIGIIFTNKAIFSDPAFQRCQVSFASFHFFVTALTLFVLSRPRLAMFTPEPVRIKTLLPLAVAMSLNVILPNASLQFSSVTFYQLARILLTPTVAMINYIFYSTTIPRSAVYALVPACVGVGIVSYYDSKAPTSPKVTSTSFVGVIFAFAGVLASSLYTVWVSSYQKSLKINSMQLLYNQAPVGSVLLLYIVPWTDNFWTVNHASMSKWMLILLSGVFAMLINLSQFFIIGGAGPVSSTVVGHLKTCAIVTLGWISSGRSVGDKSIFGILLAIAGIVA
ncbi:MAG: hypothetical protein L6R38_006396 [Xanthoria sp. 2 TBL-2021]|nr:MAG: hypothetical protein L6R38_006396 [Xanthoria sp. 2 TBL-2021]